MKAVRSHPDEPTLALYAGGDLSRWQGWTVSRHLSHCADCNRRAEAFRHDRASLRHSAPEIPGDLDWQNLATEMTANIRVGLAAGECVAGNRKHPQIATRLGWKPAAVFGMAASLLAAGWWLNMPHGGARQAFSTAFRRTAPSTELGLSVRSVRDGIEVKQDGATMTLMNPGSTPGLVTASTGGVVRARYVDVDTGQVTIANVYAE